MYRVAFRFTHGGIYYSESFDDLADVDNLVVDILNSGDRVRLQDVECSADGGETWEPYPYTARS